MKKNRMKQYIIAISILLAGIIMFVYSVGHTDRLCTACLEPQNYNDTCTPIYDTVCDSSLQCEKEQIGYACYNVICGSTIEQCNSKYWEKVQEWIPWV